MRRREMMAIDTRWMEIASRAVAAAVGGYALSSATAVCLALALPIARSEAVLVGIMTSFIVYICAVLWVFAAASARRAWIGLAVPTAILGGISALLLGGA